MKTFHCSHCQALVFFENVTCLVCGHALAYLPEQRRMAAFAPGGQVQEQYSLCSNYVVEQVCNWAVPVADGNVFCESCRLTRVIPDLAHAGNREAWYRLEKAKRRLLYTLQGLQLPVAPMVSPGDGGLAFEFLQDQSHGGDTARVLTGHDNGRITVNVAEADDVHREQQRVRQQEPYRTLIGHFRHEIGHYYWDRLIAGGSRLQNSGNCSAMSRPTMRLPCRSITSRGRPSSGRTHSYPRTPVPTPGRTGPKRGRTSCTWWMRSKPRAPWVWSSTRVARTSHSWIHRQIH